MSGISTFAEGAAELHQEVKIDGLLEEDWIIGWRRGMNAAERAMQYVVRHHPLTLLYLLTEPLSVA